MKLECHCKNITLTLLQVPKELASCNCSICRRYNSLWGYYQPEQVDISIGEKGASAYLWNDKCIEFIHCKHCGCVTHYRSLPDDPSPIIAINFRMAQLNEVSDIPIRSLNGAVI